MQPKLKDCYLTNSNTVMFDPAISPVNYIIWLKEPLKCNNGFSFTAGGRH